MSWRHVFDAKHVGQMLDDVAATAKRCGYNFFAFNGAIYFVDSDGNIHATGLKTTDLS